MGIRLGVGLPGPFFISAGSNGHQKEEEVSREFDRAMKYAMKVVQSDAYLAGINVTRDELVAYGVGAAAEAMVDEYLSRFGSHTAGMTKTAEEIQWAWYDCKIRSWTGEY